MRENEHDAKTEISFTLIRQSGKGWFYVVGRRTHTHTLYDGVFVLPF